jgi:histidinol-phosphate aminotransferase
MSIPVPANIKAIKPYVPGKPVQEVERELGVTNSVKMASNENPLGPSPKAMEAVRAFIDQIHIYPEGAGYYLCDALASHYGVRREQVILGNGSVEIVEMSARAFLNESTNAVFSFGSFALYPIACQIMNSPIRAIPMADRNHDLDALLKAVDDDTRLMILDNPINPTGRHTSFKELEAFIEKVPPHVLVILDEAYKEYATAPDYATVQPLMDRFPNLMVLGTFSKAYGLAALRIGYGFAQPDVIATLHKVRSPFNTNAMAQIAAIAALKDQDFVRRGAEMNAKELAYLAEGCTKLGIPVTPSQANFILIDVPMPAGEFFQKLMREGVIVRPMAGNGYPNSLRVSVFDREGNDRFLAAAKKVLGR